MKIKVCGMRDSNNISSLMALKPDFVGFIFYENSKRFVTDFPQNDFPINVKKVGVFVNAAISEVIKKVNDYHLDCVQLHGDESPEYCKRVGGSKFVFESFQPKIIKAFAVDNSFDFTDTEAYKKYCDYFLFDTKGKDYGGTGLKFNWDILQKYKGKTPYFLSGGIGLDTLEEIKTFLQRKESDCCYAIDVNSRFEDSPGLKNIEKLKEFKNNLQ